MADADIVKTDFMVKRSQNRSRFTKSNFKSRWFILNKTSLSYHAGTLHSGIGKEKGNIKLENILCVEKVDEEDLALKPNSFQICYKDHATPSRYTLYITASCEGKRQEWIDKITAECNTYGMDWDPLYHPRIWNNGHFSCCYQRNRQAVGCTATSREQQRFSDTNINGIAAYPSPPIKPLPKIPTPLPKLLQTAKRRKRVMLVAMYNFEKGQEGDLDLIEGEEVELVNDSNKNWWIVKNSSGEEGYIPSNYCSKISESGLERFAWFHKDMSRIEAEQILLNEASEGCFLIRLSLQKRLYTLSLYNKEIEKKVLHYHIHLNDEGLYYISSKHPFQSLTELVDYHKLNSAGIVGRLRSPPSKYGGKQPATAGFGHDKWEIDPNELVIGEMCGKGQFGEVRRAKWRGKQEVAVKTMQQGAMSELEFIDEAKTMMALQHTHLVQLYGVCSSQKPIMIVCEFMKYGALSTFVKRRRSQLFGNPDRLLGMCMQVALGMGHLESNGFIHRDLAARNCLVGDNEIVKVADFGLARFVVDEYTSSLGSKFPIKWAPPEVLSLTRFSTKSDVWSFGVLMWEVFSGGDIPYGPKDNGTVAEEVIRGIRLPQPPHCPDQVFSLMQTCWVKAPERRPTFLQLQEALETMEISCNP